MEGWSRQAAYFIQTHATQGGQIPPLINARVSPLEKIELEFVKGWRA